MYFISEGGDKSPQYSWGTSTAVPWGWAMLAREEPQPAALALPDPAKGRSARSVSLRLRSPFCKTEQWMGFL